MKIALTGSLILLLANHSFGQSTVKDYSLYKRINNEAYLKKTFPPTTIYHSDMFPGEISYTFKEGKNNVEYDKDGNGLICGAMDLFDPKYKLPNGAHVGLTRDSIYKLFKAKVNYKEKTLEVRVSKDVNMSLNFFFNSKNICTKIVYSGFMGP